MRVGIAGVAKKATATDPLIVANEVVCNALARALLLPCPPGATFEKESDKYFFSLDFGLAGQDLPPADPESVVSVHPRLSWGIIVFDSLIMNFDRHEKNLAHDAATNKVQIFDHSHAFLHAGVGDISATLQNAENQICIGGHCLAPEIDTEDGLQIWQDRVTRIPDFFIEGVMDAALSVGLPSDKKQECVNFMKRRRDRIGEIIRANMALFPKLPQVTQ